MRINLGTPMTLWHIARVVGGRINSPRNAVIKSIVTDSRELEPGDLFIALKGANFDGEDFTNQVEKLGGFSLCKTNNSIGIIHENPLVALLALAEYYIQTLPIILYNIGITGSVGKSTTKEFLKILLSGRYKVHSSEGNHNNEIGMPLSILSAPRNSQILLMEMGMNHTGEIARLSSCLHPDIALITNIGTAHIGNLGSREAIAKAKLEIAAGMNKGTLFVPHDEPLLDVKSKVTFSTENLKADYYLYATNEKSIQIFKDGKLYCQAEFYPAGEHNKKCLISAAAIAIKLGISSDELAYRISTISDINTRQSAIFLKNRYFYTDYYNASRESVFALIKWANEIAPGNKKSLVLGDILELGGISEKIHFEIGSAISSDDFNNLFLFGEMSKTIATAAIYYGFPKEHIFINTDLSNPTITANQILKHSHINNPIFMKASRGVRLERVLNSLKE